MKILLGSQSPRRRELLAGLDIAFTTVRIDADESYPAHLQAGDIPLYIAREKALAYACRLQPDELLLTADTIVWSDGRMLGKPHDTEDAKRMLRLLSGKTHQVYTGVCFTRCDDKGKVDISSFVDATDVTFKPLFEEEIAWYVDRFRPLDKAGAYGIQEWIGYAGVTGISGSYFNVMGFPVDKVYDHLKSIGAV